MIALSHSKTLTLDGNGSKTVSMKDTVLSLVKVKVKVKLNLEQTTKAQRGIRGIALLFL
jgi:hypothetical protein